MMVLLLVGATSARAQWLTQTFPLKAGWNAVYLHIDASHETLDNLIGSDVSNPIEEIWMWAPNPSVAQFVTQPQAPTQPTHWANWVRVASPSATLTRLPGNVACLIRSSSDYTWNLKGRPVVPNYQWASSGLNFLGFPTVPGAAAPTFDTFFTPVPELKVASEIYAYQGGAITDNPVQIFDLTQRKVQRGEAFWIRAPSFNRYFGPFEVVSSSTAGVRFGTSLGQASFRLRNHTAQSLTVTMARVASEAAPTGQPTIEGQVPVLVRGERNLSTLGYDHVELAAGPVSFTLEPRGQPGSDIEVVIGVNRQMLTGAPGDVFASILRFTDSRDESQVDVPVSAEIGSTAGLWVGAAILTSVNHYLNTYAKATNSTDLTELLARLGLEEGVDGFHYEIDPATSRVLVFGGPDNNTGSYLLDGPPKVDPGTVARPFPLRLIVHHDGSTARLLQRAYYGIGLATNPVVAIRENLLLPSQLASARRISAVHLPVSAGNQPWAFTGAMEVGGTLSTVVQVAYDDHASNPFLHTYHPDHDNLNASFNAPQPPGVESYGVRREITLTFTAAATDFDGLTRSGSTLSGNYVEVVSFLGKPDSNRQFTTRGEFTLYRVTDIDTLTQ